MPVKFFVQKGEFSQGVPGGNEWRETLARLNEPDFRSGVLLFQSPFIESNELGFERDSKLRDYLSAPLQSFYLQHSNPACILLPVHWWIQNSEHMKFKAHLANLLRSKDTATLLSTQEFWEHFQPWLHQLAWQVEPKIDEEFRSSGALRLHRITMTRTNH